MADVRKNNPTGFRLTGLGIVAIAIVIALLIAGVMTLRGWISVPQGHFVILLKKTGNDLSNDELLATAPDTKGVQLDVLTEGYHFFNPYSFQVSDPIEATVIPENQIGILVRKYGKSLPPGQVLAEKEDEKGIMREPLLPGRHYINTYAFGIELSPMVKIDPGFVGVVTLMVGKDPQNANVFVVQDGERGTQPYLLPPGTHPKYSNTWVYKVVPVDVRSQKLEMAGENAVDFLSEDGFPIHTEATIVYAMDQQRLEEMYVMFVDDKDEEKTGGLQNIENKLILPYGRSLYRIYGAQHKAVDYLIGSTRIAVQNQVETELRDTCAKQGILIRSFTIKSTDPPTQILEQFRRREVAKQQKAQYQAEVAKEIGYPAIEGGTPKLDANGSPMFDHGVPVIEGGKLKVDANGNTVYDGGQLSKELQTRMKDRAEKIGAVRVGVAGVTRSAEQYTLVELTKANQRLEVAKLELQAADDNAARKVAVGQAAADVIRLKNEAQAAGVNATVSAFGSGDKYAQYILAQHFAPAVRTIWSNTDGLFAELFRTLSNGAKKPDEKPK